MFKKNILEIISKEKWELKNLGEIASNIYTSSSNVKEWHIGRGTHPVIRKNISKLPRKLYECIEFVNPEIIKTKQYCELGDIVIANGVSYTIARNCVYLGQEKCMVSNGVFVIKHNENPNFLSWALASAKCKKEMRSFAKGERFPCIYKRDLIKTKVPIPPKHVQEVIANFLDELETHKNELVSRIKKEVAWNKKKYKYYRDYLLGAGEIKILGDVITDIYKGQDISLKKLETGKHPAIRNTLSKLPRKLYECIDFVDPELIKNKRYCEHGDIVICAAGYVGRNCVYLGQEKCILGDHVIALKHREDPNFLSWALTSSNCKKQIRKFSKRATVDLLSSKDLVKIQVPIILKEEQSAVANILDELFDVQQQLERELERELELIKKLFKCIWNLILWDKFPNNF